MRILSIGQVPTEVGGNYTTGVARVVYELSKEKVSGVDNFLYATNISQVKAKKLCTTNNEYLGYVINPFALAWDMLKNPYKTYKELLFYKKNCFEKPLHMAFIKWNIKRAISIIKPDILHLHGSGIASLYFARGERSIPILQTYHGVMWDGEESKFKVIYHSTYQFADYTTGLNRECERKMLKIGIDKDRIAIVPNGVDSNKYCYSPNERLLMRQAYNVDDTTLVFITVGYVVDRKGQLAFLKILNSLGLDYQYWIIGKGPDCQVIEDYCVANGIRDKVKLIGYVKDVDLYKYLSAADIYAHASTTEGQALSETEAYASGLRVIVNKLISDTVAGDSRTDKETYYICDFDKVNQKELIAWINTEQRMRNSRGNTDWSIIAKKYAEVYAEVFKK